MSVGFKWFLVLFKFSISLSLFHMAMLSIIEHGVLKSPTITVYFFNSVNVCFIYLRTLGENQDGGIGRHTAPPRTTRTDRESNSKGDQHQGNRK